MNKPLSISMGEPAGVGPDIILQLYARRSELGLPPFCIFSNVAFLKARAQRLGFVFEIKSTVATSAVEAFAEALPVVDIDVWFPTSRAIRRPCRQRS